MAETYYYIVDAVTDADGSLTASVPEGVSWVGQPHEDTYLIKTIQEIDASEVHSRVQPIPDALADECDARGLICQDVLDKWTIGGVR